MRLTLLRHGRADWPAGQYADFDRPLDTVGLREAATAGTALAELVPTATLLLHSPAARTTQTAIQIRRALREPSLQVIADAIAAEGAEVWLGGAGPSVAKVATATGSAVNLWGVSPEQLAQRAAHSAVTWAGVSSWWNDWGVSMEQALDSLEQAGARWCVVGWPPSADDGAQRALLDAFAAWRSR